MYKDVFPQVHGELAEKAIAPGDAALMQSAENVATGKTMKGGPAAVMQSAAAKNVRSGSVARDDISDAAADRGVSVVETESSGRRAVSEFVAGQVRAFKFFYLIMLLLIVSLLKRVGGYEKSTPLTSGRSAETFSSPSSSSSSSSYFTTIVLIIFIFLFHHHRLSFRNFTIFSCHRHHLRCSRLRMISIMTIIFIPAC